MIEPPKIGGHHQTLAKMTAVKDNKYIEKDVYIYIYIYVL